jgi:hypothetical protein
MNDLEKIKDLSPKLYNNLGQYNYLLNYEFAAPFVNETQKTKAYLVEIKKEFDSFDEKANEANPLDYLELRGKEIFGRLNEMFINLGKIAESFSEDEYRIHQLYIQKELYNLIGTTPFNRHIYEKPLGYPGDFVMMNYLYEDGYVGDSTYEKLIHRYSCSLPISRANINRKGFFKNQIKETLNRLGNAAQIASVACGPAKELIEVIREETNLSGVRFTFFDFEPLALEQIKKDINGYKRNQNIYVSYVNENILTILKQKQAEDKIKKQDLIYAAGLIDYMNDKISARFIATMYALLNKGGKLIVGNVSSGNEFKAYTEMLGEWWINYRNENEMLKLTHYIDESAKITVEYERETRMNVFLIIEKDNATP